MYKYDVGIFYGNLLYNKYAFEFFNPFFPHIEMVFEYNYPKREVDGDLPKVTLNDVFKIMPMFRDELDKMNDIYYMFEFLLDLSHYMVDYRVIKNIKIYKYLVTLLTAHNLSLHIRELKDEHNLYNLENEKVEANYYINDISKLSEQREQDSLKLTYFGRKFLEIINPIIEWEFKGSIKKRGYNL